MRYLFLSAVVLSMLPIKAADASSCHTPKRVDIVIPTGEKCFSFRGRGNQFVGTFKGGQRVIAKVTTESGDGGIYVDRIVQGRSVENHMPDFSAEDQSTIDFRTRQSGRFVFSFSPCSDWQGITSFKVCAL